MKKISLTLALAIASVAIAKVNLGLWFDGTSTQVNTGGSCMYDYVDCDTTTMGYWFDYDDRSYDHGGSYVLYPYDTIWKSSIVPMIENLGYLTIKYHLEDPTTTGQTAKVPYNFVGFGFNTVNGKQTPLDITATDGLCITYTSDYPITLEIAETVSGDASCNVILPRTLKAKTIDYGIEDFEQPSWTPAKNKLESCADAFAAAKSIKFKIDGNSSPFDGQLRIFEVGPFGTCKGKVAIGAEPKDFEYKSTGRGSTNHINYANSSLWFNGTNQQVNTGGDCMYDIDDCPSTEMGYWFDYDDRKFDGGGSYASYPYPTDKWGSNIKPEIDNLGYVTIKYHLEDPELTGQLADVPYNFVGFGFNTVNGEKDPLYMTALGGLCVSYTSDYPITLEIAEAVSGDYSCFVTLPKSVTPRTIEKLIDDFEQPSWTKKGYELSSCKEAFEAAETIKFKIDGGAKAFDGQMRIFEIGPIGTCTGRVSKTAIASEPSTFGCKSNGSGTKSTCTGITSSSSVASSSSINYKEICETVTKKDSSYVICDGIIVSKVYIPPVQDYKEVCETVTRKDSSYVICDGITVSKVYIPPAQECKEDTKVACSLEKTKTGYDVICNKKTVGTIRNSSETSKLTCTENDTLFSCKIKSTNTDAVKSNKPAIEDDLFSISVVGRKVTLNGFGDFTYYQLLDMQGNTVDSGYSSGTIDFASIRSGNYILKVKGNITLTKQIVLK